MPPGRANHRKRYARVTRGRLDDSLSGLQDAFLFGVIHDREGEPVLDRAHGIEGLDFDVQVYMVGTHAIQPNHRRIADRLQNIVVDHRFILVIFDYSVCSAQK